MSEKTVNVSIDSDVCTRKGVHSDYVQASTKGGSTRLDFFSIDIDGDDGNKRAVLSARVYLDNADIVALREMLVSHTDGWNIENGSDEG